MVVELTSTSPDTMLHYLVMIRHRFISCHVFSGWVVEGNYLAVFIIWQFYWAALRSIISK